MTLEEIKSEICNLRCSIEELSDECWKLWTGTEDKKIESVADYLHYELTNVACRLSDLEETETETDEPIIAPWDDTIEDWWDNLDYVDKSEIANVPMPTNTDGRGEELLEFDERCLKWWNSRTSEQKHEIRKEWEREY